MPFRLDVFPVLNLPGLRLRPTPHPRRPDANCPTDITYSDDFLGERRGGHAHHAIDIFGAIGLWIVATTDGRVVPSWTYRGDVRAGAGWSEAGGHFVRMTDTHGNVHYYAHLRDMPFVIPDEPVSAGQRLGLLGRSGSIAATTCPHLHYQVRGPSPGNPGRGGAPLNPYAELRRVQPLTQIA